MRVMMSRFGTSLCTRASGKAAYALINDAIESCGNDRVVFDFSSVFSVTNSFADEVFGRLASERGMDFLRVHTTFDDINREIALLIRAAMERRLAQKELARA